LLSKRIKIETANLERGMYVAQLDRPWLETPFMFQGFEIREDNELKLLRQFCRHVYVDVSRSKLPKDRLLLAARPAHEREQAISTTSPSRPPLTLARRLLHSVSRLDPTGVVATRFYGHRHYRNRVPTRKEAPQAIRAYDAAVATMNEVLDQLRNGAGVPVEQVQAAIKPLVDSILRNQDAMAWLVHLRKREEYTYHHSIASSVWAVVLGRHLGFDRHGLDTLALGGMLLDIGKARLPESLLTKTGPLTGEELAQARKHVDHGIDMVKLTPAINADVLAMIAGHHERHDGSGYPKGLKGADIPVFARIAGLVDCYDAMTSHRGWGQAKSPYDAIRELNTLADVHFQQEIVEHFVQALGMFPTGSLVELNTGEVGVVLEQNHIRRLRPKVMLLLDAHKAPMREYRTLDLRKLPSAHSEEAALWIVRGHEAGAFGIDPKNYLIG
jgi:HD-GYP domain-containing protein (c-di-GMP phosphodiesterase class II)